ncbi:hypothetical protein ED236_00315 [Pseudomethylobacillus aquaticus]|uniref:Uncharacterized protein n=1 Tax=Pseudomethylobacillus aquaticus TaxID=2676064 RepID=A0A3N0V5V2_9PROT|nr:hypothetical protein [Pseudomethylobacillus aquaticus]ROH87972.1 hypothetical protein ED236_00315 [Pseudomethylobacillus aquaticus]
MMIKTIIDFIAPIRADAPAPAPIPRIIGEDECVIAAHTEARKSGMHVWANSSKRLAVVSHSMPAGKGWHKVYGVHRMAPQDNPPEAA